MSKRLWAVLIASVAVLALAACDSSNTATDSSSGEPLATYKPSSVESDSGGTQTITSPDPVSKLSDFYAAELEKGGWNIVSKSVTGSSANYTATRGGEGVSISVYTAGSGSGATISVYSI